MSAAKQRLALAVIDFLRQSVEDGTVKDDDSESINIAIQCIGEAFGFDPADEDTTKGLSIKPANLQSIFDVYLKTASKVGSTSAPSTSAPTASTSSVPTSADDKANAEKLKQKGNQLMSTKQFDDAIAAYTEAIALDPKSPIYYSNRAAAYSSKGDHISAVGDAEEAIKIDPAYVKSYHRLGHAYYALSDFSNAASAFERGLAIGTDEITTNTAPAAANPMGDLGGVADMLRGMGMGGAGGGGMPDFASMMNNPQVMQMAQQMAQNGGPYSTSFGLVLNTEIKQVSPALCKTLLWQTWHVFTSH
ncbi:TPR-like protein [Cylindrobasidium torrendii FP15055 ss-10]|uniref:TPR-like protein n=1 Tax=Cylindrobasidium torrendii FP15055 ss-10 TaxID=1314674 RepID=A0A0D7B8Q4_9AGAR|nr:TPR-like protein [Cylindrobasidium torrendii FP15055 ss-10]